MSAGRGGYASLGRAAAHEDMQLRCQKALRTGISRRLSPHGPSGADNSTGEGGVLAGRRRSRFPGLACRTGLGPALVQGVGAVACPVRRLPRLDRRFRADGFPQPRPSRPTAFEFGFLGGLRARPGPGMARNLGHLDVLASDTSAAALDERLGWPWRDVPARYGPWDRVYDLFQRWQRDGTWKYIFTWLQAQVAAVGRRSSTRQRETGNSSRTLWPKRTRRSTSQPITCCRRTTGPAPHHTG